MEKLAFGNTLAPEPPQAQQNSVPAWRVSHDNACAQLEHQHNWCAVLRPASLQGGCLCLCVNHEHLCRLLNLELAQKYGPRAWQAHVEGLAAAQQR